MKLLVYVNLTDGYSYILKLFVWNLIMKAMCRKFSLFKSIIIAINILNKNVHEKIRTVSHRAKLML
jgi:hypothetical protein